MLPESAHTHLRYLVLGGIDSSQCRQVSALSPFFLVLKKCGIARERPRRAGFSADFCGVVRTPAFSTAASLARLPPGSIPRRADLDVGDHVRRGSRHACARTTES